MHTCCCSSKSRMQQIRACSSNHTCANTHMLLQQQITHVQSKYAHTTAIAHAEMHACCLRSISLMQQIQAGSKYKQEAKTSRKQIHTCCLSSKSHMLQITGSANTHMQQIMQKIMKIMHAASTLMQQSCIRPEPIMPA